jgi:hypothetical protein
MFGLDQERATKPRATLLKAGHEPRADLLGQLVYPTLIDTFVFGECQTSPKMRLFFASA